MYYLGLKGNPLNPEIVNIYNEPRGIEKLLTHLLDNIQGKVFLIGRSLLQYIQEPMEDIYSYTYKNALLK